MTASSTPCAAHEWDAVIDNRGHVPRHVRDSADCCATWSGGRCEIERDSGGTYNAAGPAVTALDTPAWFRSLPEERGNGFELNLVRDRRIPEEWRAR